MTKIVDALKVDDDLSVAETAMRLEGYRHLPVLKEGQVVGVLSERDLLSAQPSSMESLTDEQRVARNMCIRVSDVMSPEPHTISPDETALKAARLLKSEGVGCLPVVDGGRLVGIITERDFVDFAMETLSEND